MRRIHHSHSRTVLAFLSSAILSTLLFPLGGAEAAGRYDPILEFDGPNFRVLHAPDRPQWVEDPPVELSFIQPRGIAARTHDGRDVVYVLDAGRHRILAFEANATYVYLSSFDLAFSATPAAGEFSDAQIRTPEFLATPTQWVVPFSEAVQIAGEPWTRVEDLTGYIAADQVYTIDYAAGANGPVFDFPAGSLDAESVFEVRYLISDLQDYGSATPAFALGEIDRGVHSGDLNFTRVTIDELSGGPSSWDEPRGLALSKDVSDSTTDVLYVIDSGDLSGGQNEEIFSYTVTLAGAVAAGEAYDDLLTHPAAASVAEHGAGPGASAWLSDDSGPFDQGGYPFVTDASQVTGHDYDVTVASSAVTITDATTGRVLVRAGAAADVADPCLVIPGLSLPLNAGAWSDGTSTVHTTRAYPTRFLFVADSGGDRLKVVALASGVSATGSSWAGDWLPGDARTGASQPTGANSIGAAAGDEYSDYTPAAVPENFTAWTAASPIRERSLSEIVFDPTGLARSWRRVDNLEVAGPADSVFVVDETRGSITFGDGIHGTIPPASTEFVYNYSTSPDVLRYGSSGTALGRFTSPRGVAARWNRSLGRFDLYVADAANLRLQKLAFFPADTTLHLAPRIVPITSWNTATSSSDWIGAPGELAVAADSAGTVHLAVTDPSHQRVILYRDSDANVPGSTLAPSFFKVLGVAGNRLGGFVEPAGVTFLGNGADLDLYATDDARNVAVKYEGGPNPSIDLITVGESELPAAFPPHSGYLITFETRFPPLGGWVDFYFDTKDTFDESTARLCFPVGTVSPTATSVYWNFADSPGGLPPDGSYFLFARLKDSTGSTVAWDQTDLLTLITIDSHLLPTIEARDAIDGDGTLYLQNNLERDVHLEVAYPDSVIGAAFVGRYDPRLVAIEGVTPGSAWDGLGGTNVLFAASVDSVNGRFQVHSSVVSAPIGLTRPGPHIVATLHLRCRANAIDLVTRAKEGQLALDATQSTLTRIDGTTPDPYRVRSLNLRVGYLGDIATTDAGADSIVPHLQPRPDGRIDFDDQMAFTLGWNGANFVQDRISDLGPATGDAPFLLPAPDDLWDVEDILAFTVQANYAAAAGWNDGTVAPPAARSFDSSHAPSAVPTGTGVAARWEAQSTESRDLVIETEGASDLCGVEFTIRGLPGGARLATIEAGDLLSRDASVLTLSRSTGSSVVVGLSRLSPTAPGVSGSGVLARLCIAALDGSPQASPVTIEYQLRDTGNREIGRGVIALGDEVETAALPVGVSLAPLTPNPARAEMLFHFGLPRGAEATLTLFDVQGRQVRSLTRGPRGAGWSVVRWDGRRGDGSLAPSGIYYARLQVGTEVRVRKLILSR